jgi:hypothetical protein
MILFELKKEGDLFGKNKISIESKEVYFGRARNY